jgi:hypothetical protein
MPATIAALLLALGCAPAEFSGPAGAFVVWVCAPVVAGEAPAAPPAPPPAAPRAPELDA